MALSNRDRIGQMLEALAGPVDEFISSVVAQVVPEGKDWTVLLAAYDADRGGGTARSYQRRDPQIQFRFIADQIPAKVQRGWYPFDDRLSRAQLSYVDELKEVRNRWAHNDSFTDDDAYRALDTAERFLTAIGAPDAADKVGSIRRDLRRRTSEKDDQKTLKRVVVTPESAGLLPWREVLPPHEDVASGQFQASEFAADLYKVSHSGQASGDYADPVEFFARTYLTEGLRDLINRGVRRLAGDENASPVVNLQTNFGGGKTHSMLSLWHLAGRTPIGSFPQELQELLEASGYRDIPDQVARVALVGNHISPSGSIKADGTEVRTLWGELAWQLGGVDAYRLVERADQASTPPGEALHELLRTYSPAVILIDEWVAYARALVRTNDLPGGTFDDQFTFAQALTEAVKGTPGVLLAISIPASEAGDADEIVHGSAEEVGGADGLAALKRLQNVVRRVADQWRPASPEEAYHIVRQRLFVVPDGTALGHISATARKFGEFYRKHSEEFPREARDPAYEERIKRTYPIHPELFDRLYEDWSALERFQRTRGVLRLMNAVIHALWEGGDQGPLILPGSIPLSSHTVNAEITQYLPDSWKAVIDADVDGTNSEPALIDKERPLFGQRALTKRLARTVFFGAAPTIGSSQKGLERARVFLGTATPGDVPGNFHSALAQLGDRATYFYTGSGKYWYDLQANITRRAKDQAERLHREEVWAEISRRLEGQSRQRGDFVRVHVCPESSADIPDVDEVRLVILHPKLTHKRRETDSTALAFAKDATERRGAGHREFRNMVVFLAADEDRMSELEAAVRDYLGWEDVLAHQDDLDLTGNQKNQALERRRQAAETADARLLGTFQWALVPIGQPVQIEATKVEGQSTSLAERVSKRLITDGALIVKYSAGPIRSALEQHARSLWADGHVPVGKVWNLYADFAYMPRVKDREVFLEGLHAQPVLWDREGFALADSYDSDTGRYRGLILPTEATHAVITNTTLLVKPEVALQQREQDSAHRGPDPGPDSKSGGHRSGGGAGPQPAGGGEVRGPVSPPAARPKPGPSRYFAVKTLREDLYAKDFKDLADEVLLHLRSQPGSTVTVRVEIEANHPGGYPEHIVRTVSENATTLKFDQSGFEAD